MSPRLRRIAIVWISGMVVLCVASLVDGTAILAFYMHLVWTAPFGMIFWFHFYPYAYMFVSSPSIGMVIVGIVAFLFWFIVVPRLNTILIARLCNVKQTIKTDKVTISILLRAMFRVILYILFISIIVVPIIIVFQDNEDPCPLRFYDYEQYKRVKASFEKTWDSSSGHGVEFYETKCLKDKKTAKETANLIKIIKDSERDFQYKMLQTIINDPEISKSILIKSEYIISKYIKDANESNRHISKSVDILLNSCDDKCIDEIFRVSHNVIFDTKVQPCEIIREDAKLKRKNNQKSNKHLDFLKRYCNK